MSTLPRGERGMVAIEAQLTTISQSRGYWTDAGSNVFRARQSADGSDLPCLILWDDGEQPAGASGSTNHSSGQIQRTIGIEGYVKADQADTGRLLGLVQADVMKALMGWAFEGGVRDDAGQIGALSYAGSQPIPRGDGSTVEGVRVAFTLSYKQRWVDPTRE